jgi:hypothetical protein
MCLEAGHSADIYASMQLSEEEFVNAPPPARWGRAEEIAQAAGSYPPDVVSFFTCHLAAWTTISSNWFSL